MKGSYVLIISSLLLAQCNNKPNLPVPVELPQSILPVKPFVASNGEIYKSKTTFHLQYNNLNIDADRVSSWEYPSTHDSVLLDQYHYITKVGSDSEEVNLYRYYLSVRKGEQYHFPIKGKANIWLNAFTTARLSYTAGLFNEIKLVKGECYIEALNNITIALGDSLKIECSKGSELNLDNDSIDKFLVISLKRGDVSVYCNYNGQVTNLKMQTPGKKLNILRTNGSWYHDDVESDEIGSWREGKEIRVSDASLPAVMMAIDRWYNTITSWPDTIPATQLNFAIPGSSSLDEAIRTVNLIAPVQLKRKKDSIFVFLNNK